MSRRPFPSTSSFFFNDTATTEIYTLSLHDALPICPDPGDGGSDLMQAQEAHKGTAVRVREGNRREADRKSTRLNSSHANISYAVFCLKKKKHTHRLLCWRQGLILRCRHSLFPLFDR